MHPASSRPTRSNVKLQVGPLTLNVDVYGGQYKPPSATSACVGHANAKHDPVKVKQVKVCSVCEGHADGDVGEIVSARASTGSKLVPISESAKAAALEASAEHRDAMPVVRVPVEVLSQNVLESAEVNWLVPSSDGDTVYAGLVLAVRDSEEAVITRWASQKNVYLYRLVERDGVLGMVKLVPAETLRVSPIDPIELSAQDAANAKAMANMALGMAPTFGREQLVEISGNPYAKTIADAADRALESGVSAVRMANQNRTTFGDNLAAAKLAAMLEGVEL